MGKLRLKKHSRVYKIDRMVRLPNVGSPNLRRSLRRSCKHREEHKEFKRSREASNYKKEEIKVKEARKERF